MNHLIIYTHSNEGSFNAAIRDTLLEELLNRKQEVRIRLQYLEEVRASINQEFKGS